MSDLSDLKNPPIFELGCGIFFDDIEIDPMTMGLFWHSKHKEYPGHKIVPPFMEEPEFRFPALDLRAWMISDRGDWILQVQKNCLLLSWCRKKSGVYPGFAIVSQRAIKEFQDFSTFLTEILKVAHPKPNRLEVVKVNRLEKCEDLAGDVPEVAKLMEPGGDRRFSMDSSETIDGVRIQRSLTNSFPDVAFQSELTAKIVMQQGEDMMSKFSAANLVANKVFERTFSQQAMNRFRGMR